MNPSTASRSVVPFGDRAVLVHCGTVERAWALDARLADPAIEALRSLVEETVPGWATVLLHLRPGVDPRTVATMLASVLATLDDTVLDTTATESSERVLPVVYDGADLDEVAALTGRTRDEVVRLHAEGSYRVAFVGFSPGFAYLTGLDDRLAVPRRSVPRPSVPAGSVAIGGGQAGVYPSSAPGGWHLLGRTDAVLFDPTLADPSLLRAGDRVRFAQVERLSSPPPERRGADRVRADAGAIEAAVVRSGSATVQGAPRTGLARSGVPTAGPSDPWSASVARRLVGSPEDAPILEVGPLAITLDVRVQLTVAVPRGAGTLEVDGTPVATGSAVVVDVGSTVCVRPVDRRSTVLAVAGLSVPGAFGASHDVLSGLGPSPIVAGGSLLVRTDRVGGGVPSSLRVQRGEPPAADEHSLPVRCVIGPHVDADDPTVRELLAREWTVSSTSNRVGTRLEGAPLSEPRVGSIPSLGMVQGAVQVPPGGLPVVLGPDHGTTGGYPVVAVVIAADLPRLAVLPVGARLRLRLVDLDEALVADATRSRSSVTAVADLGLL